MRKIFLALCLLSLSLSGCAGGETSPKSNHDSAADKALSGGVKTTKQDCLNGCIMMWKSNSNNAGKSDADMMRDCNSLCDAGQGMQNNDADACAKADDMMRDTCYVEVAKNTDDPSLCEKVTDEIFIASCYSNLAEKRGDKSLCEKIPTDFMRAACLAE